MTTYMILLVLGIIACIASLLGTIVVGLKPKDVKYTFKGSMVNLGIIYFFIFSAAIITCVLIFV